MSPVGQPSCVLRQSLMESIPQGLPDPSGKVFQGVAAAHQHFMNHLRIHVDGSSPPAVVEYPSVVPEELLGASDESGELLHLGLKDIPGEYPLAVHGHHFEPTHDHCVLGNLVGCPHGVCPSPVR